MVAQKLDRQVAELVQFVGLGERAWKHAHDAARGDRPIEEEGIGALPTLHALCKDRNETSGSKNTAETGAGHERTSEEGGGVAVEVEENKQDPGITAFPTHPAGGTLSESYLPRLASSRTAAMAGAGADAGA